ncbi:uncharacterized protein LOC129301737 [Prosopis cineraria]|uniref:uncharacterized protein LOC129301737 n=1 Tax=Prosopis cineraria TaxID=364024 RepID=UPI00240F46EB|nr:uncharacterized protein LOC129301737 [Prosopis cineraria]
MDYDFRTRSGPPHDAQVPIYRQSSSSSPPTHPMYGPSLYPKVGPHGLVAPPPAARPSPHHQTSTSSVPSGLGIKVAIKPEYRITPPPHLLPHGGDIPRSNFQFDFDLERKVLAEAEKQNPNWSRFGMEILPAKSVESTSPKGPVSDPIVSKYIASGLNREAVPIAVANYGDNPTKVQEFVNGYTLLREMGFATSTVAEALIMNDNDTDKALAHCLNGPS